MSSPTLITFNLPHQVTASQSPPSDAYVAISDLVPRVFGNFDALGLFQTPKERQAGQQSLKEALNRHMEYFLLRDSAENVIGWSFGSQHDTDTYFMAWTGIDPNFQSKGIYSSFLKQLLHYLKSLGYERVTSKHLVNNRAVLIAKLKAGFDIMGLSLDERWGAQIELVYHFHADRYKGFKSAYSLPNYGSKKPLD